MIPWRLKAYLSRTFPLAYHLAVNVGRGNSPEHWDAALARSWDDPLRTWPTKVELIAGMTRPGDAILDVGCGNGSILRGLKAKGWTNLHGLEISPYAVGRLGSEGITMHAGLLPHPMLRPGSYDLVIASQVLEHIIRRRPFLREIARLLKPGGRAFFFVPDNCLGPIDEPEHVVQFTERSLRKCLLSEFSQAEIQSFKDENHPMGILWGIARAHG